MDSQKRIIKYQMIEAFKVLAILWGVLLLLDIIGFIATIYFNNIWSFGIHTDTEMSIVAGNIMAIFIFFIAYSYTLHYEDFPIAICFSITRKDYYKSVILQNLIVSFAVALFEGILLKIEPYIISAVGINPIQDFSIFNTKTNSLMYIVLIMFIGFLINVSFWNLVAALNYKFGYKLWIVATALFILFIFTLNSRFINFLDNVFSSRWIEYNISLFLILFFGIFTVICYVISYFITFHTNVKHRVG